MIQPAAKASLLLLAVILALTAGAGHVVAKERETLFPQLEGWAEADVRMALKAFSAGCSVRPAHGLRGACASALALHEPDAAAARRFFERWFTPRVLQEAGFLTAYFEPELHGSRKPDATRTAPALSMPTGSGALPERADIENGALSQRSHALLYLDPVDLFVTQIQGSARIRLDDGQVLRLAYAGRNGKPYTAIGKLLVERGVMALESVTMDRIVAWLRANPDAGRALMRENKSYVFFRIDEKLAPSAGPVGAAGVPLTAGHSLAVDHRHWQYGLPVWIDADMPDGRLRRLTVAQDTGTAIVGPARADLFLGTGSGAGERAGAIRHAMRMTVLVPRLDAGE